jgi:hypothetical protein
VFSSTDAKFSSSLVKANSDWPYALRSAATPWGSVPTANDCRGAKVTAAIWRSSSPSIVVRKAFRPPRRPGVVSLSDGGRAPDLVPAGYRQYGRTPWWSGA